jgi:hypothetical protein
MAKDLIIETPGASAAHADADTGPDESAGDLAAKLAAADATIAQLSAALADANSKLQAAQTVPAPLSQPSTGARLIGEDWSGKTSAEARAAGVDRPVLCSDGYYVP